MPQEGLNIGDTKRSGMTFDRKFNHYSRRVLPGDYAVVTDKDEMITTTLGSCVAACIRDPLFGIGGMNHFLLSDSGDQHENGKNHDTMKYGHFAMELLINELIKKGCNKNRFEIKVFGGAHVGAMNVSIGQDNSEFILKYIEDEGLNLVSQDLGGNQARKINFFPHTGRVARYLFKPTVDHELNQQEKTLLNKTNENKSGEIELFT